MQRRPVKDHKVRQRAPFVYKKRAPSPEQLAQLAQTEKGQHTEAVTRSLHQSLERYLPSHPDLTDRVLERQFEYWNKILHQNGWERTRGEVVSHMLAAILWFDVYSGPNQTFELLQDAADGLLMPQLPGDPASASQPSV
jgi:hypothetical protein